MKNMMMLVMCVFMFSCFPENVNNNVENVDILSVSNFESGIAKRNREDQENKEKIRNNVIKEYDNLKLFRSNDNIWSKKIKIKKESEILIENIHNKIFGDIQLNTDIKNDCDKLIVSHYRVYLIASVLKDEYNNIKDFKKSDLNLEETDRIKQLNCKGSLRRTVNNLNNYLSIISKRAKNIYCNDSQFFSWIIISCY